MRYLSGTIMASDAALEMFALIDDLGATKWQTRRDRVHQAMQARGYTPGEIDAAERELTVHGTIEQRDDYLAWARPSL
jgi:hypothetical protein